MFCEKTITFYEKTITVCEKAIVFYDKPVIWWRREFICYNRRRKGFETPIFLDEIKSQKQHYKKQFSSRRTAKKQRTKWN